MTKLYWVSTDAASELVAMTMDEFEAARGRDIVHIVGEVDDVVK